ncbi:damage-inducible protein DinB [Cruoricaptor ignavus]|uniref:Damage-inducible protein DinB n=1 Tax=Cruoricaptor ignavus TaxID=1118202 RepID=A0A7M1T6A2_9FLAO|nr:DinB family protein [Cruoricaptor ignavus]QOR74483.1 damage-inducible protein DinB [Cruoricaptor ignavus]
MMKQALLQEFEHEAENTRKLLKAIPDSALGYRPQPELWSVAQLASHIVDIYYWYEGTFNLDTFDVLIHKSKNPNAPDLERAASFVEIFEENYKLAKSAIENSDEATYNNDWKLVEGEKVWIGPMPKIIAIRSMLYNHLYHHRGELVAHLRATGNKVPGLYGPTYDDKITVVEY